MDVVAFFVADPEAPLMVEPGKRRLDDRAESGKRPGAGVAASRDQGQDTTPDQRLTDCGRRVVGLVRQQHGGTQLAPSSVGLFDHRERVNQRHGHTAVVHVGRGV